VDFESVGNALFDRRREVRRLINGPAAMNWDQADSVVAFPELGWVVCGAESGPRARPMKLDWARRLRDHCFAAEVPFFMKQLCDNHGRKIPIGDWPQDLQVRQLP